MVLINPAKRRNIDARLQRQDARHRIPCYRCLEHRAICCGLRGVDSTCRRCRNEARGKRNPATCGICGIEARCESHHVTDTELIDICVNCHAVVSQFQQVVIPHLRSLYTLDALNRRVVALLAVHNDKNALDVWPMIITGWL